MNQHYTSIMRGRVSRVAQSVVLTLLLGASALTVAVPASARAGAILPPLGTAARFGVLGGSAVTNTGPTDVRGDLGVSPGNAVSGFPPGIVRGTIHAGDAVAAQAQNDAATAYNNAAGQACDTDLTGQDLGGMTLTPGVYCFASSAQLTGQLTLDGQGNPDSVFIFKVGSTLTTASNAEVLVINNAQPCRIFWQVGSSATLGTNTVFQGNILALTSITLTTGATTNTGLYALNGAVTLDTNDIQACDFAPGVTSTASATNTSISTATAVATATLTALPSTNTPVNTPVPAATDTTIPPATDTPVQVPTDTPVPAATDTAIPSLTNTPANTVMPPTNTPRPRPTGVPTDTPAPGATGTPLDTAVPTNTAIATDVATNTPLARATPTDTVSAANTPINTVTLLSPTAMLTPTALSTQTQSGPSITPTTLLTSETPTQTLATQTPITPTQIATPSAVVLTGTPTIASQSTPAATGTAMLPGPPLHMPHTGGGFPWLGSFILLLSTLLLAVGLGVRRLSKMRNES